MGSILRSISARRYNPIRSIYFEMHTCIKICLLASKFINSNLTNISCVGLQLILEIYAWYDLEVVKYNTVLSSDMSCQDYNDDFNVHYCHGSNTCSVGLVLLTTDDLDYFSYDVTNKKEQIVLGC